jgi:hypothetical protein
MRLPLTIACLSTVLLAWSGAAAAPILAPPGSPDFDASLDALRKGYERMEDEFVTPENGLFLDPIVAPAEVITVEAFFAQIEEQDFELFSGKHPYEVLLSYDEHGDEGNFAGVASVGVEEVEQHAGLFLQPIPHPENGEQGRRLLALVREQRPPPPKTLTRNFEPFGRPGGTRGR